MQIIASIDPVTRIEGHMRVEVSIDTVGGLQQVTEAKSVGTLFRGFEKLLIGRDPRDAQHITERICGVCPVSHAMAAVLALDSVCKVSIPKNALLLRNLVMGANFLDSHILHFYLLAALDFIDGPAKGPWQANWSQDRRFTADQTSTLLQHYLQAIAMKRKAQELGALFGGRVPHPPTYVPGGFTEVPTADKIALFKSRLQEVKDFIMNVYIPDVEALAEVYPEYGSIGRGYGNLLAFGAFSEEVTGNAKLFRRGRITDGAATVKKISPKRITEQVKHSWYKNGTSNLNPAHGKTSPINPKNDAYSWLKAPRYANVPYEVGPLARMWVNGDFRGGISVLDRHRARALEALKIAEAMESWTDQVQPDGKVYNKSSMPTAGTAIGLTEAPRGALGHWLDVKQGKISLYQVITPSCWNCSPQDDQGLPGPLEQALIGTPVADASKPVEVLRVLHSFDPCLDCAVHAVNLSSKHQVTTITRTQAAACQQ